MIIRKAKDRGKANFDWLASWHTFSFGGYQDPQFMGIGPLRVINEDRVIPSAGFAKHGHREMEIITYVLSGSLQHKDSLGNGSVIKPGEVQRMTAGTGIEHSEFNASSEEEVHFLQIWVLPQQKDLPPSYEQKQFSQEQAQGQWQVLVKASPTPDSGIVSVNQDIKLQRTFLNNKQIETYQNSDNRWVWIQIARGSVSINNTSVEAGDGIAVKEATTLHFDNAKNSEILLFDLPKM